MGSLTPPTLVQISASGTPFSIGHTHGTLARAHITRCINFYQSLFHSKCSMDWSNVTSFALKYQSFLAANFPQYVEEMRGVASGAGKEYEDILALNVRTEIAFGAFSDGCTALSWKSGARSFLGQNWDWDTKQAENLVCLKIEKEDGLKIQMITEAGIIGKIGMSSAGVGCTLNAIMAKGVAFGKVPVHLALRTVMESSSRAEAIATLERFGVASACHILVADSTGGTGLECSSEDILKLEIDERGVVAHTNHFLVEHKEGVVEKKGWLPDTEFRLKRVGELLGKAKPEPSENFFWGVFQDEVEGVGASICRKRTDSSGSGALASLFGIVMDLENKKAEVMVGRPIEPTEKLVFSF